MIFEAASTRTRVSFENGFAELGGNALYLRPGEIHLPGRESIADTARTLSQYNAAIEIRAKANETVNELAEWASVPVINGMDHDRHPCQSMSDAFTILETAGTLAGVTFAYLGDAAHPCNSLSTTLDQAGSARARRQRRRLRDRPRAGRQGRPPSRRRAAAPSCSPTTRSRPSPAPISSTPTAGGGPARRRSTPTASPPSSPSR